MVYSALNCDQTLLIVFLSPRSPLWPPDGHKGLGPNPLQANDYNTSGTIPLKKSESKKNIDRYVLWWAIRASIVFIDHSLISLMSGFSQSTAISSSRPQPLRPTAGLSLVFFAVPFGQSVIVDVVRLEVDCHRIHYIIVSAINRHYIHHKWVSTFRLISLRQRMSDTESGVQSIDRLDSSFIYLSYSFLLSLTINLWYLRLSDHRSLHPLIYGLISVPDPNVSSLIHLLFPFLKPWVVVQRIYLFL